MGSYNRRRNTRIPLQIALNEYIRDQPYRSMTLNLSESGLYVNRLVEPARDDRIVGLEFELPGTAETVWARGEIVYDNSSKLFSGTGIRFAGMAALHQRMITEYVLEQQARELHQLLAKIRRNRRILLN